VNNGDSAPAGDLIVTQALDLDRFQARRWWHIGARRTMSLWGQVSGRAARIAFALALLCAAVTVARAEVQVEGDEAALRVSADKATLGEVLAALQARYRLRFDPSLDLGREVSGTLTGSLHRVVVSLLAGYDFVVKRSSEEGVEIIRVAQPGTPMTRERNFTWRAAFKKTAAR
jgi:hypothetical protein